MVRGLHRFAGFAARVLRQRRVSCAPPPLPDDLSRASFTERKRYVVYQMRTLQQRSTSQRLTREEREAARERAAYIRELLHAHPLLDDLSRCIEETRAAWGPL